MFRLLEGLVLFFVVFWVLSVFVWKVTMFAVHLLIVFAVIALILRLFGGKSNSIS